MPWIRDIQNKCYKLALTSVVLSSNSEFSQVISYQWRSDRTSWKQMRVRKDYSPNRFIRQCPIPSSPIRLHRTKSVVIILATSWRRLAIPDAVSVSKRQRISTPSHHRSRLSVGWNDRAAVNQSYNYFSSRQSVSTQSVHLAGKHSKIYSWDFYSVVL